MALLGTLMSCFFLGPEMQRHISLNNGKFYFPLGHIFGSKRYSVVAFRIRRIQSWKSQKVLCGVF